MSSAEHIIESLLDGMAHGEKPEEILRSGFNPENLKDANMTEDTAIRIACLVIDLYDGEYPPCFVD